jgi:AcrR family transcriptional regulator
VRILAVAQEALRPSSDASINSIAKEAEVGIAKVFRHFPTREELVLEVYRREMRQAVDAAPELLEAGQRAGTIRPGLTAEDFFLAMHGLWRIDPKGDWKRQSGTLTDILIAGISHGDPHS